MIYVIGMPGTGKTTFALELGRIIGFEVVHTDDYIVTDPRLPSRALWAETGERVAGAVKTASGNTILEGVQVSRMLPRPGQPDPHGVCLEPDLVVWCRGPSERLDKNITMRWVLEYATYYQKLRPERVLVRTLRRRP